MKYDKEQLYKKRDLSVREVAYLLGGVPVQGIYRLMETGKLGFKPGESELINTNSKRIPTRDVINYILKRKGALIRRLERYKLPDELE